MQYVCLRRNRMGTLPRVAGWVGGFTHNRNAACKLHLAGHTQARGSRSVFTSARSHVRTCLHPLQHLVPSFLHPLRAQAVRTCRAPIPPAAAGGPAPAAADPPPTPLFFFPCFLDGGGMLLVEQRRVCRGQERRTATQSRSSVLIGRVQSRRRESHTRTHAHEFHPDHWLTARSVETTMKLTTAMDG
jgi:hypothetical protein